QLEFSVKAFLSAQIGLAEEHFDAVTAPYDFRMLCIVTQEISLMRFPNKKKAIKSLFKGCLALNDERNRVAHGLWSGRPGGSLMARHVARTSLKVSHYFENPEDLARLADTAQRLMADLFSVVAVRPDANANTPA
ncbi:MAG: hypothetical protein ACREE4_17775, partial [Stellaceae bacterium]